jgi:hypothetical protein
VHVSGLVVETGSVPSASKVPTSIRSNIAQSICE